MRNVSDRVVEKIKTHILCLIAFFYKLCCLWYNVEKYGRAGQSCIACWVTKVTDRHSEYVILIAFPQQQWFCECALMLCTLPVLLNTAFTQTYDKVFSP